MDLNLTGSSRTELQVYQIRLINRRGSALAVEKARVSSNHESTQGCLVSGGPIGTCWRQFGPFLFGEHG